VQLIITLWCGVRRMDAKRKTSSLDGDEKSSSRSGHIILENEPRVSMREEAGWDPELVQLLTLATTQSPVLKPLP
jgi:hypothetical protein